MAAGSIVEFIPARRPEAIRMDASQYKIIKPEQEFSPSNDDDSSVEGGSSSSEDGFGSVSDSGEESSDLELKSDEQSSVENSDADSDSDSDSNSDTPIKSRSSGDDVSHKPIQPTLPSKAKFYDINEYSNDNGTREPRRIHKSWPAHIKATLGLENRGVTCYMNAAIQALLHVPALGRYLLEVLNNQHREISKSSVTYELAILFKRLMDSRHHAVFPRKLILRLEDINPMLSEWNQEDSHEYYMSLISRLQEDSVPRGEKLNSSIICDMFAGSVKQKVTCRKCESVSTTDQDFYDLPVSFSPEEDSSANYTLEQSIRDFFTPEVIEASNGSGYQCENCKQNTSAVKQIAIKDAPEYLTVHIKRFKMENNVSKKVKDSLHYPIEMDLSEYETTDEKQLPLRYKLLAVIVHEGRTLSSGHYIAYARQPNGVWVMYDDEATRKVKESEAADQDSAYILLYSRLLEKPQSRASREKAEKVEAQKIIRDQRDNNRKLMKKLKESKKKNARDRKSKLMEKRVQKRELDGVTSRPRAKQAKRLSAVDIEDIFSKRRKH